LSNWILEAADPADKDKAGFNSMKESIVQALEVHAQNPRTGAQMSDHPEQFAHALAPLLVSERDTDVDVVGLLCDPRILDKETAIELARLLREIDSSLDTKLLGLLPGSGAGADDPAVGAVAERILELVQTSDSARAVPLIMPLMRHRNPRLRAKAALLIGRRVRNASWLEGQMNETDGRVRANAVESAWGERRVSAIELLRHALFDTDNRVVGNALYALYSYDEPTAAPAMMRMAVDVRPRFRATAAWIMGQAEDRQFLPVLEKLSHDLYASVRRNALKAIQRIGERENQMEKAG
jgi:HEAT repeat protein